MDNTSYILASRQNDLFKMQDRIADSVANVNTTAFKQERDFASYMTYEAGDSKDVAFAHLFATKRDTSEGPFKQTHRTLDLAIKGDGFFRVETPLGARFTRAGNFTLDTNGNLVTQQGYLVVGPGGQQTTLLPEDRDIKIKEDGVVVVGQDQEARGQIGVFIFSDTQQLERVGQNLYKSKEEGVPSEEAKINQGMLELSNVNSVATMTELIDISRQIARTKSLIDSQHQMELDAIKRLARVN